MLSFFSAEDQLFGHLSDASWLRDEVMLAELSGVIAEKSNLRREAVPKIYI